MQYKNRVNHRVVMVPAIAFALIALTATAALAHGSREARERPVHGRETGEFGVTGEYERGRGWDSGWERGSERGWGNARHHGRNRGWDSGPRHHRRDGSWGERRDERSEQERISAETAQSRLDQAVEEFGDGRYEVIEIMEFENDFYAQVRERGSDRNAFELLVDAYTGRVFPEPGPNMMWNTEYSHMGRDSHMGRGSRMGRGPVPSGTEMDAESAEEIANDYVAQYSPSASAGDTKAFPGYYTMHVFDDEEIVGMLSVNARTGRVWYHDWHGAFRGMVMGHHEPG